MMVCRLFIDLSFPFSILFISFFFSFFASPSLFSFLPGLKFYEGENLLLEIYSLSGAYTEKEFELKSGVRELKWVFFKDGSDSKGLGSY